MLKTERPFRFILSSSTYSSTIFYAKYDILYVFFIPSSRPNIFGQSFIYLIREVFQIDLKKYIWGNCCSKFFNTGSVKGFVLTNSQAVKFIVSRGVSRSRRVATNKARDIPELQHIRLTGGCGGIVEFCCISFKWWSTCPYFFRNDFKTWSIFFLILQ